MGIQSVAVHSDVDSSAVSGKTTVLKNKWNNYDFNE